MAAEREVSMWVSAGTAEVTGKDGTSFQPFYDV
jgi:hypothetical protein